MAGSSRQSLEDLGRHLNRIHRPLHGFNLCHATGTGAELIGQTRHADITGRLAHPPLDGREGIAWIQSRLLPGLIADAHPIALVVHHGGQQMAPLLIGQGLGAGATHHGDQRVGGTQIDAHRPLVLVWCGAEPGFGNV